jgi:tryptophanyl-tRNA synthetase
MSLGRAGRLATRGLAGAVEVPRHPPRTFSGIQPTGGLHLGNYLGAVRGWVGGLKAEEPRAASIFCVVDMHAISLPQEPAVLRANTRIMAASLLACGLDPRRCILFQQSTVPEHAELCWVLASIASVPRLGGLTQYKEKAAALREVPLGLFIYPVLQAADILLYKATRVPVGEDNLQNLQVARDLRQKFNRHFYSSKSFFPLPEAVLPDNTSARLRSLRRPEKKMSKSDPDTKSCIYLTDTPDQLAAKVTASVTDSTKELEYNPGSRPGVANLMVILSELTGRRPEQVAEELVAAGTNKVQLKELVTAALVETLGPIQGELARLLRDPGHLELVLEEGRQEAAAIAAHTMADVRRLVGFTLE